MAKVTNLVLYAHFGAADTRRPVASFGGDLSPLEMSANISAAAAREFINADKSGAPKPRLKLVRETREGNEQGQLTFAEYCECDQNGKDSGTAVPTLDALFTEKK